MGFNFSTNFLNEGDIEGLVIVIINDVIIDTGVNKTVTVNCSGSGTSPATGKNLPSLANFPLELLGHRTSLF